MDFEQVVTPQGKLAVKGELKAEKSQSIYDKKIKSYLTMIKSPLYQNCYEIQHMNITSGILCLQVKPNGACRIEIGFQDIHKNKRFLTITNQNEDEKPKNVNQKEQKSQNPLHVHETFNTLMKGDKDNQWFQIFLDIRQLCKTRFFTVFQSVTYISIGGHVSLRRIVSVNDKLITAEQIRSRGNERLERMLAFHGVVSNAFYPAEDDAVLTLNGRKFKKRVEKLKIIKEEEKNEEKVRNRDERNKEEMIMSSEETIKKMVINEETAINEETVINNDEPINEETIRSSEETLNKNELPVVQESAIDEDFKASMREQMQRDYENYGRREESHDEPTANDIEGNGIDLIEKETDIQNIELVVNENVQIESTELEANNELVNDAKADQRDNEIARHQVESEVENELVEEDYEHEMESKGELFEVNDEEEEPGKDDIVGEEDEGTRSDPPGLDGEFNTLEDGNEDDRENYEALEEDEHNFEMASNLVDKEENSHEIENEEIVIENEANVEIDQSEVVDESTEIEDEEDVMENKSNVEIDQSKVIDESSEIEDVEDIMENKANVEIDQSEGKDDSSEIEDVEDIMENIAQAEASVDMDDLNQEIKIKEEEIKETDEQKVENDDLKVDGEETAGIYNHGRKFKQMKVPNIPILASRKIDYTFQKIKQSHLIQEMVLQQSKRQAIKKVEKQGRKDEIDNHEQTYKPEEEFQIKQESEFEEQNGKEEDVEINLEPEIDEPMSKHEEEFQNKEVEIEEQSYTEDEDDHDREIEELLGNYKDKNENVQNEELADIKVCREESEVEYQALEAEPIDKNLEFNVNEEDSIVQDDAAAAVQEESIVPDDNQPAELTNENGKPELLEDEPELNAMEEEEKTEPEECEYEELLGADEEEETSVLTNERRFDAEKEEELDELNKEELESNEPDNDEDIEVYEDGEVEQEIEAVENAGDVGVIDLEAPIESDNDEVEQEIEDPIAIENSGEIERVDHEDPIESVNEIQQEREESAKNVNDLNENYEIEEEKADFDQKGDEQPNTESVELQEDNQATSQNNNKVDYSKHVESIEKLSELIKGLKASSSSKKNEYKIEHEHRMESEFNNENSINEDNQETNYDDHESFFQSIAASFKQKITSIYDEEQDVQNTKSITELFSFRTDPRSFPRRNASSSEKIPFRRIMDLNAKV